jgi:hypothetical protein
MLPLRRVMIGIEQRGRLQGVSFDPRQRRMPGNSRQRDRCQQRDDRKDANDFEERKSCLLRRVNAPSW